jgi:hypothetical protein
MLAILTNVSSVRNASFGTPSVLMHMGFSNVDGTEIILALTKLSIYLKNILDHWFHRLDAP